METIVVVEMGLSRSINVQFRRLGQQATYYAKSQNGRDEHNNPEWDYVQDGTVTTVRSYPNRNEQHDDSSGPYEDDQPVFFFPAGEAPPSDARLDYEEPDGTVTTYEMRAPTHYDTHVTMYGALVSG